MKIGTVKEIKKHEYRVGLTPTNVSAYVNSGHQVFVQHAAGVEAGFSDEQYIASGAVVKDSAKEVFDESEMIIKVKEPQKEEWSLFHQGQILYTYLHLAASKELTVVSVR